MPIIHRKAFLYTKAKLSGQEVDWDSGEIQKAAAVMPEDVEI